MKKILLLAITTAACALSASPVGNPASPNMHRDADAQGQGELSVRAGYLGDFVSGRKLKAKKRDNNESELTKGFDNMKRTFNGVEATVNVNDTIDVIGRLGYAGHEVKGSKESNLLLKTKPGMSYGIGVRAAVYQVDNTSVAVHGFYSQDNSSVDKIRYAAGGPPELTGVKKTHGVKLRDKTFAVGVTVSQKMENFAPYIGLQYVSNAISYSKPKVDGASDLSLESRKNRKNVGAVVGVSVLHNDRASLNLEGRFINEQAVGLTGQVRF